MGFANHNCPDPNGEVLEVRQLVLIDALEHAMMNDFLLRVGGKISENMRLFVCKTVVFRLRRNRHYHALKNRRADAAGGA